MALRSGRLGPRHRSLPRIWLSLEAVAQIPCSGKTEYYDGKFKTMSYVRFCSYCGLRILRASIAAALLYAGVLWLGGTTSIEDLILSAVATGLVQDYALH